MAKLRLSNQHGWTKFQAPATTNNESDAVFLAQHDFRINVIHVLELAAGLYGIRIYIDKEVDVAYLLYPL